MTSPIADGMAVSAFDTGASGHILGAEALLVAQKQSLEMVVQGAPLGEVLSYLTRIVEKHAQDDVIAAILLLDAQGCLHTGAAPSLPQDYNHAIDGLKACEDVGTCSVAAATGRVVVTPDIAADPKWGELKSLPLALGLKAAWSQPILARSGRVLGTFGTYFRECREPMALERHLVAVLSHTAALAIEREEVDASLEEQRRLLDTALNAAEMGTWRYSFATQMCEFNHQAQALYAVNSSLFHHDEEGVRRILHPDDIPIMWEALRAACDPSGDGRYNVRYRVRRRDGGWRWLSVWGLTDFDGEGDGRRPIAVVGASRDITEHKDAESKRTLLIDELSHRVKNTLAIVQSIASQTLRQSPDPATFNDAFSSRISALARAHSLLTRSHWRGTPLNELVSTTLVPFTEGRGRDTHRIDGPSISITPNAAVTLCLVFHELATNATKYGALSAPQGRVSVVWEMTGGKGGELALRWQEEGGPPVETPKKRGFGFRLIEASGNQLGGKIAVELEMQGLTCRFRVPLDEILAV